MLSITVIAYRSNGEAILKFSLTNLVMKSDFLGKMIAGPAQLGEQTNAASQQLSMCARSCGFFGPWKGS